MNTLKPPTNTPKYYKASDRPEELPAFHKSLMYFHLFYVILLPTITLILIEIYHEPHFWFRLSAWLVFTIYLAFVVNNYKIPSLKASALWFTLSVPLEIFILSLIFGRSIAFGIIEWSLIEVSGFFIGLLITVIFKRDVLVSLKQRLISFAIVGALLFGIVLGYWEAVIEVYLEQKTFLWGLFLIPYLTSVYNNSRLFLSSSFGGEEKVNHGISPLSDKFTAVIAICAVLWFILPFIMQVILDK